MLKRELFDLGFKAHSLDVQKTGSGFDIAASTYGGTLYFEYAGKKIEKIEIDEVPILYANLPSKFDTPEMVRGVKVNAEKYPELYKQYIETIKTIVNSARKAIEEKNWKTLGELMSANQGILESIGVNTEDSLVACHIAKRCGAWGAKMTGGGGDNIIILADPSNKEKIKQELEKKFPDCFIDIKANASGVRIDES